MASSTTESTTAQTTASTTTSTIAVTTTEALFSTKIIFDADFASVIATFKLSMQFIAELIAYLGTFEGVDIQNILKIDLSLSLIHI